MRTVVSVRDAPPARGPYSHATVVNGLLFCSGQLPLDPSTGDVITGDTAAQARRCLENLKLVCSGGGGRIEDAARLTIYLVDLAAFTDVNRVCEEFFPEDPPARSTVQAAALPGGAAIEIDAIVAVAVEA